MQPLNVKAMLRKTNGTSEERQSGAHRERSKTYGNMAASHSGAVQRGDCFCLRVGLKPGPQGVRGKQIRSFLSAHKRMRIYTRKCLSLCQIGFQSVPPEVGGVATVSSKVVPVQVLLAY